MSTLEDLDDLERDGKKEEEQNDKNQKPDGSGDADMKDADEKKKDEEEELIDMEILNSSTRDIISRRRLLENDTRIMKSEYQRLTHEKNAMHEKIKDNVDKIDNNR
jgi:26S proteasome regulatory subunit T5